MKYRFTIFALLFCCLQSYSQQSKELLDEAKQRLEGKWVGISGKDSIVICLVQTFTNADKLMGVDSIAPLYGWHKVIANGKTVEESFSLSSKPDKGYTVSAGYKKGKNQLYMVIHDITRNRALGCYFTLQDDNSATLKTWLLETWRLDGKRYPEGQTFPKEIRLRRLPASSITSL